MTTSLAHRTSITRLLLAAAVTFIGVRRAAAESEPIVLGGEVAMLVSGNNTTRSCEAYDDPTTQDEYCGCCVAHRVISMAPDGAIDDHTGDHCTQNNFCNAQSLSNLDPTLALGAAPAAANWRTIANQVLVARRLPSLDGALANPIDIDIRAPGAPAADRDDANTQPQHHARAQLMGALDDALAAGLPLPPPVGASNPVQNAAFRWDCVKIKQSGGGTMTEATFFVRFSTACLNAAPPQAPQVWNDYVNHYVLKVLARVPALQVNPVDEVYNLESLRLDLLRLPNGVGDYHQLPAVANGQMPKIITPTFVVSYFVLNQANRMYMTVMPVAKGAPLKSLTDLQPGQQPDQLDAQQIRDWWGATGAAMAQFHNFFRAPQGTGALLRNTVVHGDFHYDNVFIENVHGQLFVTLIDNESMATSLYHVTHGAAPPQWAWADIQRIYFLPMALSGWPMMKGEGKKRFPRAVVDHFTVGQLGDMTAGEFIRNYWANVDRVDANGQVLNPQQLVAEFKKAFTLGRFSGLAYGLLHRDSGIKPPSYAVRRLKTAQKVIKVILAPLPNGQPVDQNALNLITDHDDGDNTYDYVDQ